MKTLFTIVCIVIAFISFSQEQINPSKIYAPDLSKETQNEIDRQYELMDRWDSLSSDEKSELDTLLLKYGEVVESVWDIIDGGCSWYCGGGNYEIKSSSSLTESGHLKYSAKSANDLNYKTAWVEGMDGDGIGEYLEYYFKNKSPRITSIIITNGYVKSESTWVNNNRVKKLKMYVNDKPYKILNLEDSRTDQVFEVDTLGRIDSIDMVLKFEILEIYKGLKFDDTAITEIYFDGIDVH